MNTRYYFDLGFKFAHIKTISATNRVSKEEKEKVYLDFITVCKMLNLVLPENYKHLISINTYSDRFLQPLILFKQDIYQAGVLTFSIYLLNISSEKIKERELKKLNLDTTHLKLDNLNTAIKEDKDAINNILNKWKIETKYINQYVSDCEINPHKALNNLFLDFYPILDQYIKEDDLPKNWKEKLDKAFDLRLSLLGASIDLNYIIKKWLMN